MSENARLLLYRIYLESKKKSEESGSNEVGKYLLHHNFFKTDERLSKEKWDEDLFLTNLAELANSGYVYIYVDNSFRIEDYGIEFIEDLLEQIQQ